MWFVEQASEFQAGKIGRIDAAGHVTEYSLPDYHTSPVSIALGPDGNLWFTEAGLDNNRQGSDGTGFGINRIGEITPSGVLTEHDLPPIAVTQAATSSLGQIVSGPQGALWFAEPTDRALGRMTTDGAYTEFLVPSSVATTPLSLAATSDGALWFNSADQIGVPPSNESPPLGSGDIGRFVAGSGLSATAATISAPPGLSYSGPVATFTATAPGPIGSYSATIDWGDGSPIASATIVANGSSFVVSSAHTFARPGTYSPRLVVRDTSLQGDAATATGTITLLVAPPPAPTVIASRIVSLRHGGTSVVLTFSGPLDPSVAKLASRYVLTVPGPNGRFGSKKDATVRVKSFAYDAATHEVTITTRHPLPRNRAVRVAIAGGMTLTITPARASHK